MKVYVAGNYNGANIIECLDNIKRGTKVCVELLQEGYTPFCPWLDFSFHWYGHITREQYQRYSMDWLEVSEAVYVLDGAEDTSEGTRAEILRAIELGIPVYYQYKDELPRNWGNK